MKYSDLQPVFVDPVWASLEGPAGKDGRDGSDGLDGGRLVPQGAWKPHFQYEPGDIVSYSGSSFVATQPAVGRLPRDGSNYWMLLAAKGERGRDGVGMRGPRGTAGADGASEVGGESLTAEFDSPVVAGQPIFIKSNSHGDLARADSAATTRVVGLATDDGYQTEGTISLDDWSAVVGSATLSAGQVYYLSAATAGAITTTAPTSGYVVPVGRAVTPNIFDLEIGEPIKL